MTRTKSKGLAQAATARSAAPSKQTRAAGSGGGGKENRQLRSPPDGRA